MVACEDSQIFNLIAAGTAAVCTIVANQGAIAEEEEVRIRVEERSAGIASKAVQMPPIASWRFISHVGLRCKRFHGDVDEGNGPSEAARQKCSL